MRDPDKCDILPLSSCPKCWKLRRLYDENDRLNRKSGVLARIYGDNAGKYESIIASLPADMQKKMITSRDCKRLIDPNACSDTCVKGFVYTLNGDTYKKCRNDGMLFPLTNETAEYIDKLVCAEIAVRKTA